jgi:hypothetical protein
MGGYGEFLQNSQITINDISQECNLQLRTFSMLERAVSFISKKAAATTPQDVKDKLCNLMNELGKDLVDHLKSAGSVFAFSPSGSASQSMGSFFREQESIAQREAADSSGYTAALAEFNRPFSSDEAVNDFLWQLASDEGPRPTAQQVSQ